MMEGEKKGVAKVMLIQHKDGAKRKEEVGQIEQWAELRCLFVVCP